MEAFSARVSAPVFDDLCVHLDLPRVYKCEMVSFQLMLTKNRVRKRASGNASMEKVLCVSVLVKFPRAETRAFLPQWKAGLRIYVREFVSHNGNYVTFVKDLELYIYLIVSIVYVFTFVERSCCVR